MFTEVSHKTFGKVKLVNSPIKLSRTPAMIQGTAPDMGEHTKSILQNTLGLSDQMIEELVASKIIWEQRAEPDLE